MKAHLFAAALLSFGALQLRGAGSSDAVGWMTVSCLGASDTIVSAPLARPAAYASAGTGSTVTAGVAGKITFSGTPFTASQFKYVPGTQANTYYALVGSGTKAGDYFPITDNDTSSVTVALQGDSVAAVAAGTSVKIIPFWTLGTLFPGGSGVTASTESTAGTEILLPNATGAGINLVPVGTYRYLSTTGHWASATGTDSADDTVLPPDSYFTVRQNGSATTTLTMTGNVIVGPATIPIASAASARQDNYVALMEPVTLSLNDSGLSGSGAFSASAGFATGDQLFVFDNTVARLHKAPSSIYTYTAGKWLKAGSTADAGADPVFTPGSGVLIRKAPAAAGSTALWTVPSHVSD